MVSKFTGAYFTATEKGAKQALAELNRKGVAIDFLYTKRDHASRIPTKNELLRCAYAKDYDAMVTLRLGAGHVTVGLEYERTPKMERDYDVIAAKMTAERYVNQFIYLTSTEYLLKLVSWPFRKFDLSVYFGLVADWHRRLLEMEAFSWKVMGYRRLATLLSADLAPAGAVPQESGMWV